MGNNYVLAMYDIRGKQEFIFRNNSIKEIVGGSAIIRDCWKDYLYPNAEKVNGNAEICIEENKKSKGIYHEKTEFSADEFIKRMNGEEYIGELVYDGGGNFLVLFKNVEIYKQVTFLMTEQILKEIGTLRVLGSYIEDVDLDDYKKDSQRLYEEHRKREAKCSSSIPWGTLPFVQVDANTSQPLVAIKKYNDGSEKKLSQESVAKLNKYEKELEEHADTIGETLLDEIVEEKGVDSHLAIIYIDGNSMGSKVENICKDNSKDNSKYDARIKNLRDFSQLIQKEYIDERIAEIDNYFGDNGKRRVVIGAGDEINLICKAADAFEITKLYFDGLTENNSNQTSCAGISIFRSHMPYSDAYKIAEECCESGKKRMKELEIQNACYIDFHYNQGAIGRELDSIREHEYIRGTSRPWLYWIDELEKNKIKEEVLVSQVKEVQGLLNKFSRTNVKGLMEPAKKGFIYLDIELRRMIAHLKEDKDEVNMLYKQINNSFNDDKEKFAKIVYDIVLMYDLWFVGNDKENVNR